MIFGICKANGIDIHYLRTGEAGPSLLLLHGYRYDDYASDVIGLIQQLELAAPVLLGHSMGGLVIAERGVVSLEMAQEIQHLNPSLRVEQIRDLGHGIPHDQPDRFEALVRTFLLSLADS